MQKKLSHVLIMTTYTRMHSSAFATALMKLHSSQIPFLYYTEFFTLRHTGMYQQNLLSGRGHSAKNCKCHLRFGIVDGCCSTTSRVSDGDLEACHSTPDVVPFALAETALLSAFTASNLSPSSAMLKFKGQEVTPLVSDRNLKRHRTNRFVKIRISG